MNSDELFLDLALMEPSDGSVLRVCVSYPGSPITYTYVALRVKGAWYLTTGEHREPFSWVQLINWFRNKKADIISVEIATSWENL